MPRIAASLAVAALLAVQAAPLAYAQSQFQVQPQTQGNVTYISGGIADDWQRAMQAQKYQYNLHLLFAQTGTGAFFANVPVQITSGGQTVLDTVSQGPFLFAHMPPGTYQVTASQGGQAITKTAFVPAAGSANLDFRWAGGSY